MRTLLKVGLFLIVAGLGLTSPAARAGGWAAVTLDSLPAEPRAGEPIKVGFTVRQHGLEPINIAWENQPVTPYLEAQNPATGELLRVKARQEGPIGHFVVEVIFPNPGSWRWSIQPEPFFGFPEYFEPLTVLPPAAAFPINLPLTRWWPAGLALVLLCGLAVAVQRGTIEKKLGLSVGTVVLVILLVGLLIWPGVTSSAASQTKTPANALAPTAKNGRALFVAKGCLACHRYQDITDSVPGPIIGPNLTEYQANPAFLRQWLRDPTAVKPDTQMPNLNLSEDEIEALLTFLLEKKAD
jgi:cytochrome c2